MLLPKLIASLKRHAQVTVEEERTFRDGSKVYILTGTLVYFPHASRPTWYSLVILPGQDNVPRREISAICRHFWRVGLEEAILADDGPDLPFPRLASEAEQ